MRAVELESKLRHQLKWAAGQPLELDPERGWHAFKALLEELITDPGVEDDLASFQCGMSQWEDGTVAPCVYFTRQFSIWNDAAGVYLAPAGSTREWILGYSLGFQYPSSLAGELGALMYWTEDFTSRQEFITAVERAPQFQCALHNRPAKSELTIELPDFGSGVA
jgi:hypothetical protein